MQISYYANIFMQTYTLGKYVYKYIRTSYIYTNIHARLPTVACAHCPDISDYISPQGRGWRLPLLGGRGPRTHARTHARTQTHTHGDGHRHTGKVASPAARRVEALEPTHARRSAVRQAVNQTHRQEYAHARTHARRQTHRPGYRHTGKNTRARTHARTPPADTHTHRTGHRHTGRNPRARARARTHARGHMHIVCVRAC